MENPNITPKLAPPGAGLPWPELQIARLMFYWKRRSSTQAAEQELFVAEEQRILKLIAPYTEEQLAKPVFIERLRGLEDSSRFWSAYMTLSHLAIVNTAITGAITLLTQNKTPTTTASTAAVKPLPCGKEAVTAFTEANQQFLKLSHATANLHTPLKYPHPWFGPLTAAGWHSLAAFHMGIHRRQIREILRKLPG